MHDTETNIVYSRENGKVVATMHINAGIRVDLGLLREIQSIEPKFRRESASGLALKILQDLSVEVGDLLLQESKSIQDTRGTLN